MRQHLIKQAQAGRFQAKRRNFAPATVKTFRIVGAVGEGVWQTLKTT